jgi:ankyrin repeat protein
MTKDIANNTSASKVARILHAAANGDTNEVATMLRADPALVKAKGLHPFWGGEPTVLHVAAEWGRAGVVRELLQRGADPNNRDTSYGRWSPLHGALHRGHASDEYEDAIALLLAHGAQVDIWAASAMGDAARIRELLAADPALVHAPGPNAASPLHFAATAEAACALLEAGADLTVKDTYGRTPVEFIASYGGKRRAAAEQVLQKNGLRDAFLSCALGDTGEVENWLKHDPAIVGLRQAAHDNTLLHLACRHGHVEIVALLLAHGADIMARASGGLTALHLAAGSGHTRVAELLLEKGAEVNAREAYHDSTPLGWAEFHGYKETASFLENRGGHP